MTYRSDQDAALARADALQVDLDRSHRSLAHADLGADVFRSCTVHTIPSGAES